MAIYKVPTDILEACKKELKILSSDFELVEYKTPSILKKNFESYRKKSFNLKKELKNWLNF